MRRSSLAVPVLVILFSVTPLWAQQVWNLSADWSETNGNPNGYWTYANSTPQAFPTVVQNFNTPDMGPGQTGWGGIGGAHEGWAKSIGAGPHDFPAGAVGAHGACRIIWTAPGNDTFTISGGGWMFRHIGRTVTWHIWKKSGDTTTELTQGTQNDGTTQFNSTTPEPFSNGTGGAGVLTQTLAAGDQLIFGHDDGDFFAYDITITGTILFPTPTPPAATPTPTVSATVSPDKNVWSLEGDWSEVNGNPNDAWTYANSLLQVFPQVIQNFNTPDMGAGQTGWGGIGGAHEGWARSIGAGPHDFPAGAVGAHGAARVIWTAPKNATYVISGGGWMFRHIGRVVTWHIWVNGTEITQGTQNDSTTDFNSNTPEPFSNGTGGEAVLTQTLQTGDKIMFGHDDPDFFAYKVNIVVQGFNPGPTSTLVPTRTPTPTIGIEGNAKIYKLDSQGSTEYLGVGVGDVDGDGTPEVISTVKGGAPGVFNDTNVFFLKGKDLEALDLGDDGVIDDIWNVVPNENVFTAGLDEGAWFASTGDFLGNGRHQVLINHRADGRATSSPFGIWSRNNTDPPGTNTAWSLAASLPAAFGSAGSFSQTGRFFPGVNRDFITIGSGMVDSFAARVVGLDDAGTGISSDTYAGPLTGNNFRATFLGDISGDGVADLGYWSQNPKFLAMRGYASGASGSLVTTVSATLWANGQAPFDGVTLPYNAPEIGKEFGPVGRAGKFFVGDPSKDGRKEVLLPLAANGAGNAPGILLSIQATAATSGGAFGSLAFEYEVVDIIPTERFTAATSVDLDGDGDVEIIAGTLSGMVYGYVRRDQAPGYTPGSVASVEDGNQYVRFVLSGNGHGVAKPVGSYVADIGMGDLDADGKNEIALSTGYPGGPANVPGTYVIDNITVPTAPPLPTSITDWASY